MDVMYNLMYNWGLWGLFIIGTSFPQAIAWVSQSHSYELQSKEISKDEHKILVLWFRCSI